MNYLDIIIIVPLVWGIYKGFTKGFVVEIASLLALILGVWCAIHFSEMTADILLNKLNFNISDAYLTPISFAVTFIAVAVVIIAVFRILDKLLSAISLGGVNKLFGAFFGGAKVFLILAIILYFVNVIDSKVNFIPEESKTESFLYVPTLEFVENMLSKIDLEEIKEGFPQDLDEKLKEQLGDKFLNENEESDSGVEL